MKKIAKNMRTLVNIALVITVSMSLVGCFSKDKPNYQFFPNMYDSPSYEAYGAYDIFPNQQSAMMPAEGTVPRGHEPYELENTNEDRDKAKAILDFPFEVTEKDLSIGKDLYGLYCAICHGPKGDGKGTLVEREKFLGVPSYADAGRVITPGNIFFSQTHGLNTMGSYASQLDTKERWQVAMHVMDLKAELKGEPGILETAMSMTPGEENNNNEETAEADTEGETQSN